MRSRNIKPGFFQNEVLPELSAHTRLLFIGLWCLCDWEGRLELRPKRILMSIFPYEQQLDINQMLLELHNTGFITMYGDGKYLQVNNFHKHQHPILKERQNPSTIPDQSQFDPSTILDRSQNDPSMIPVGLIPDILKPDILKPDTRGIEPVGSGVGSGSSKRKKENTEHQSVMDLWNKIVDGTVFPKIIAIEGKRKRDLEARLKDPKFMERFEPTVRYMLTQDWCCGRGDKKKWFACFDYVIRDGVITTQFEKSTNKQEPTQEDVDMSKPWNNPDYVPEQPMRVSQ